MNNVKKLFQRQKARKMSYEKLAQFVGVSLRTIYRWRDGGKPSYLAQDKIKKILEIL